MNALTDLYRERLAYLQAGLLVRLRALWLQQYDPAAPLASLARIGQVVGLWAVAAQAQFADESTSYLAALVAAAAGTDPAAVPPFTVPADLVGSTAAGVPVGDLTGMAPAVWNARTTAGLPAEAASRAASEWLNRVAASEPYRVANKTLLVNAVDDDRLTGRVLRVTRSDACDFCTQIADRGYTRAHAGFAAHAHCRCTAETEIARRVYTRAGMRRAALAGIPAPRLPVP